MIFGSFLPPSSISHHLPSTLIHTDSAYLHVSSPVSHHVCLDAVTFKRRGEQDQSPRLVAEGAGHHLFCIYIASSWAEKEGGGDEELGQGGSVSAQKRLLISILHIHECPVDNEREEGGSIRSV